MFYLKLRIVGVLFVGNGQFLVTFNRRCEWDEICWISEKISIIGNIFSLPLRFYTQVPGVLAALFPILIARTITWKMVFEMEISVGSKITDSCERKNSHRKNVGTKEEIDIKCNCDEFKRGVKK